MLEADYSEMQLNLFTICDEPAEENIPDSSCGKTYPEPLAVIEGMDFRAVLEEIGQTEIPMPPGGRWAQAGLVELPTCDIAWRILDAQYWGVPQRRRRIFLVTDFRSTDRCAGEILFEPESVRRDTETSGETRKGLTEGAESGAYIPSTTRGVGIENGVAGTLDASYYKGQGIRGGIERTAVYCPDKARSLTARNDGSPCLDRGPNIVSTFQNTGRGWWNESPIAGTLRTPCGGDSTKANLVAAGFKAGQSMAGSIGYEVEKAATLGAKMSGTEPTVVVYDMTHADEVMRRVRDGRSPTLNARMGTGGNQVPVVSYSIAGNTIERKDKNGGNGKGVLEETSYTLNTVDRHAVASVDCRSGRECNEISGTLQTKGGSLNFNNPVRIEKTVRRLTPTECERLQGLPDGYTLIPDKTCSDTARYKALGNGMAQPCADFVIRRIVEAVDDGQ